MPEFTDAVIPLIPMRPDRIVLEAMVGKVIVSIKIEIDIKNQKLIGNPLHGGEHVLEAY